MPSVAFLGLLLSVAGLSAAAETTRHPDAPVELAHWGQLAGEWRCLVRSPSAEGDWRETTATWTWRYVLDGRAVQDEYVGEAPADGEAFRGGALRIFNPQDSEWEIAWVDNRSPGIKLYVATSGPDQVTMRKPPGEDPDWLTRFFDISEDRFSWSNDPSGSTMECRRDS